MDVISNKMVNRMKWYLDPTTGKMYYKASNSAEAIQVAQAWRKRQIQQTLDGLHEMQLRCIDEAVEKSDCAEAKAVIAHIQSLPDSGLTN